MTVRIARIISRLNVGGPAQHAIFLEEAFHDKDWESLLISGIEDAVESNMLDLASRRGVKVTRIFSMRRAVNPWRDLCAWFAMVRIFKTYRPKIVHTHTAKAGAIGRLAAWWCGVPVVLHTFHGHVLSGYFYPLKTKVFIWIERFLGRRTTFLITLTEQLKTELQARGISGRLGIQVVPLGLELGRFANLARAPAEFRRELGLADDAVLLGIVGRLVPIKRHSDLLEAMALLRQQGEALHLAIVGGGELEAALREQVQRLNLNSCVHFCGFRQDLERIYAALDAVVLCSANEGMPVSLIEAMACGLPIVSTDVGGVRDLLSPYPSYKLVPPSGIEELAWAISETLKHHERLRAQAQGFRQEVLRRYSVENLVATLKTLYVEALAR